MIDVFNELPNRIKILLQTEGITSEKDLILTYDHELLKIAGIGEKTLQSIRKTCGPNILNRKIYEQCDLLEIPIREFTIPKNQNKWICPVSGKNTTVEQQFPAKNKDKGRRKLSRRI